MYVRNLYFRHHTQAPYFFKNLSFELEAGKIHALHGKNGVGKTVLFHILSRKIAKGAVLQAEMSVEGVELVHQRFDQMLADQFTFEENMQFARLHRYPTPFSALHSPRKLPEFLSQFSIDPKVPVYKLSGGQRQILSLMMVLQKKASIVLLDEPTATLDEENATLVFEFLRTLQGLTFLVVCHDQQLISRYVTGRHLHLTLAPDGTRTLV